MICCKSSFTCSVNAHLHNDLWWITRVRPHHENAPFLASLYYFCLQYFSPDLSIIRNNFIIFSWLLYSYQGVIGTLKIIKQTASHYHWKDGLIISSIINIYSFTELTFSQAFHMLKLSLTQAINPVGNLVSMFWNASISPSLPHVVIVLEKNANIIYHFKICLSVWRVYKSYFCSNIPKYIQQPKSSFHTYAQQQVH